MFGGHRFRSHGDKAASARWTCTRRSSSRATSTTTRWPTSWAWTLMHEHLAPLRLRPASPASTSRRSARRAALHRMEAQAPTSGPSSRSGMPARPSRWASARATTASPCCSWRRPPPRWPPAASASSRAWCARSRTWSRASAAASPATRWQPLPLKPEHVDVIRSALYGVTQEGTSARVVRRRALQERRQDRHGAGGRHQGRTRSTTPPRWKSTSATTRCTSPLRRWTSRRSRWRWWSRTPASAPTAAAPIARRVFDYVLLGQYPSEEDMAPTQQGKSARADRQAAPGRRRAAAGRAPRRRGARRAAPAAARAGVRQPCGLRERSRRAAP